MEMLTAARETVREVKKGVDYGVEKSTKMAESLERYAGKIPSSVYLGFSLDCCIASTCFALAGKRRLALMFGTWSLFSVMVGVYTKLDRHIAES